MNILFTLTGHPERISEGITMATTRLAKNMDAIDDMHSFYINADMDAGLWGHEETDTAQPCLSIRLPTNTGKANVLWRYIMWLPKFIIVTLRLYFFCRKHRIDYIVTYLHARHMYFYWLSKFCGLRYICVLHGSEIYYFHDLPSGVQKTLYKLAHGAVALTAVSKGLAHHARTIFQDIPQITTIHNGVALTPPQTRDALPFELPQSFIVSIGRLHPVKGFDLAIQAFHNTQYHAPDLHYVIIGEGDERPALAALIDQYKLKDRVHLIGQLDSDHIPTVLHAATLCLAPSRSEGLPNVILEAAFMGTPLLATRVGGIPEIIADDHYGTLVPADDIESLTTALGHLIAHPQTRQNKAENLKHFVRKEFSIERMVTSYRDLFRALRLDR
ncbi:MAG: hypothetical protein CMF31_01955 [Kordiimonas sp.]|nr:hypothetical protein [Kordiimonas sp.]